MVAVKTYLVHNEGARGVAASVDKILEFLPLDDLTRRVARVRRDDDFETLSANVLFDLLDV